MKVKYTTKGDFRISGSFLKNLSTLNVENRMEKLGKEVEEKLRERSPVDSGELKDSWNTTIEKGRHHISAVITNNAHIDQVNNLVYLIEYGHGTGTGGYVPPNPFVSSVIDEMRPTIKEEIESMVKFNGK